MIRLLLFTFLTIFVYSSAEAQSKNRHKKKKIEQNTPQGVALNYEPTVEAEIPKPDSINVSILIDFYYAYCGGAYRSDEELNNYHVAGYHSFVLINLETGETKIVKADSTGTLNLSLAPGRYGIKEMYKNCTFEEFLKHHPIISNPYSQNSGEECYRKWWAGNLGEFTVVGMSNCYEAHYTITSACFTGNNPCKVYFGPWPP